MAAMTVLCSTSLVSLHGKLFNADAYHISPLLTLFFTICKVLTVHVDERSYDTLSVAMLK